MESRSHHAQVILMALAFVLSSCSPTAEPPALQTPDPSLLQAGDLIYRLGDGVYSAYFKDFSGKEKRYSHVGVLAKTGAGDALCVVHAEANELTGQGNVRTESLPAFLKGANVYAVYRLKKEEKIRLAIADQALIYCHRSVPFDLEFDVSDSTAFYCTELIMHCVNIAAGENLIQPATLVRGKKFVAIDDTYLHDWIQAILKNNP